MRWAVPILLVVLAGQCMLSMRLKSVTFDEPYYFSSGYAYLTTGRFDLNREHPPLMKYLIGVPLLFLDCLPADEVPNWARAHIFQQNYGASFLFENRPDADVMLFWARCPTVVVSLLLGFLVWTWAKQLYGVGGGAVALLLYCFSPNILAHSRLATLDLGVSAGVFAASFFLWRLYQQPSPRRTLWAGLSLGAALLVKFTAVMVCSLIPVYLIAAMVRHKKDEPPQTPDRRDRSRARPPRRRAPTSDDRARSRLVGATISVLALAALIVTFAYGFGRFGLAEYVSGFKLGVLEREYLTVPNYKSFCWGRYSATGFGWYHFAAFLIKTPIPTLLLTAASVAWLATRRPRRYFNELFLVAPILLFFVITIPVQINFGLRYILPVYPFLFVLLAGTVTALWQSARWKIGRIILPIMGCWYAASTVMVFPNYIPYFNELIGGSANGIRYLDDSNIDWGQDLKQLARYVRQKEIGRFKLLYRTQYLSKQAADYYGLDSVDVSPDEISNPKKGWYAISAHMLQRCDLVKDSAIRFDWLDRFEPEVIIGGSIYLYRFD
jgi:4-amino-4-deoxy-L-arabinose transferase-like glycosyltransferase